MPVLGSGGGGSGSDPTALKIASNLADLANAATARSNMGLGTAATQPTGAFVPASTQNVIYVSTYSVKADAVTRSDGAMSSGSAVLTAAGASFASTDVGKVVVVNNANGSGVHLWTTIASYQSATQVTLAAGATANVTAAVFTYGTDDTTNAQTAFTAASNGGRLILPPTPMLVTSALTATGPITIEGQTLNVYYGPSDTTSAHQIAPLNVPTQAPYLGGSTIVQAGQNVNGLTITTTGANVNLSNFGVHFAGWFKNTGHGVYIDSPTLSTYKQTGPMGFGWDNLAVLGHDGAHYAWYLTNPLYGKIDHLQAWGGGGVCLENNSGVSQAYGNVVFADTYITRLAGPTSGINLTHTTGQLMMLLVFDRLQVNGGSINGDFYNRWSGALTDTTGYGLNEDRTHRLVYVIQGDLEFGQTLNVGWSFSPTTNMDPSTVYAWDPDGAPRGHWWNARRVNLDGTISIDQAEGAGASLWLLNDTNSMSRWSLGTDGIPVMNAPAPVQPKGATPLVTTGAAAGTAPPIAIASGSDFGGAVAFGTGTSPTTGNAVTVATRRTYGAPLSVVITPNNAATAALGLYVASSTTGGFTVAATNAPSASQALGTYAFTWIALVAGTPATPVVYDDANRADNASSVGTPPIGPTPTTTNSSVWGISGHQFYAPTPNGLLLWDSGKADATIKGTFAVRGGGQDGLVFRATDANNFWIVTVQGVYKVVGGSWGNPVAKWNSERYVHDGEEVTVVTSGNSITVYRNGMNSYLSTSDATGATATKHGFRTSFSTVRFSYFSVT